MIKEPTAEQSRQAINILTHASHETFKAKLVTQEERDTCSGDNPDREWWLMPAFIVDQRYWCGWDVYYGHDIVIDLIGKSAKTSTKGIFEEDYVFLSDYYGFEKGAFYYRST